MNFQSTVVNNSRSTTREEQTDHPTTPSHQTTTPRHQPATPRYSTTTQRHLATIPRYQQQPRHAGRVDTATAILQGRGLDTDDRERIEDSRSGKLCKSSQFYDMSCIG